MSFMLVVMGLVFSGVTSTFLSLDIRGERGLGNMMGDREGKENLFRVKMADMVGEVQARKMVRNSSRFFMEYGFSLKKKMELP